MLDISKLYCISYFEEGETGGETGGETSEETSEETKTFTQEEVNSLLAKERREHKKRAQQLVDDLNTLKHKATLTAEERDALQNKINELEQTFLSKEELLKRETEKKTKELNDKLEDLSKKAETWKNRYVDTMVENDLTEAAVKHNAFSTNQIVTLLRGKTEVVPILDDDNNETGAFKTVVTLETKDSKGETKVLKLSPNDAVKLMSETDEYFNLFKESGVGGLGDRNRKGKDLDLASLARNPKKYIEARNKGLKLN